MVTPQTTELFHEKVWTPNRNIVKHFYSNAINNDHTRLQFCKFYDS